MRSLGLMFLGLILLAGLTACTSTPSRKPTPPDTYAWLEEVKSEKSLAWVNEQNHTGADQLAKLKDFKTVERESKKILLAKDRLPTVTQMGPYYYNFWQDETHVRGIWRRTTPADFKTKTPHWETLLDLDQLAHKETENWVYKSVNCLEPVYDRCLLSLSRGGGDAVVVREYRVSSKGFVHSGFELPEAKNTVAWVDQDHLLIASDFGPNSLTTSGYPREVRFWARDSKLVEAPIIFSGKREDVGVTPFTVFTPKGNQSFVSREITFYESKLYTADGKDGSLHPIEKPLDADFSAWQNEHIILRLKSDWKGFRGGDLVELGGSASEEPQLVFSPHSSQTLASVGQTKDALVINYLDNIQSRLSRATRRDGKWVVEEMASPELGNIAILSSDAFGDELLMTFQGFLVPPSIQTARVEANIAAGAIRFETLKSLPARFDAKPFQVQQLWATSKDGTRVPYFLVARRDMLATGQNPVLMYGYGGFEISSTPTYLSLTGKLWLEKGGTYVVANIRGGGEFGPQWHEAAVKANRQKAYDDFIAVAEDLVQRKMTSPGKLAISGRSNGGLLVSAAFVERPDLFHAVVCGVPLTDMLRYNKLLAGASWMAEYGDPDKPEEREYLEKYSPYQNVRAGVKYPEVFFMTSTMDDRVHPSHARKMAAKLHEFAAPVVYFENTEGGHAGSANLSQRVKFTSLEYTFLRDRLLKAPREGPSLRSPARE